MKAGSKDNGLPLRADRGARDERGIGQALRGLPAVEGVGIGAEEEEEIVRAEIDGELHRRGEAAEERRNRRRRDA